MCVCVSGLNCAVVGGVEASVIGGVKVVAKFVCGEYHDLTLTAISIVYLIN